MGSIGGGGGGGGGGGVREWMVTSNLIGSVNITSFLHVPPTRRRGGGGGEGEEASGRGNVEELSAKF